MRTPDYSTIRVNRLTRDRPTAHRSRDDNDPPAAASTATAGITSGRCPARTAASLDRAGSRDGFGRNNNDSASAAAAAARVGTVAAATTATCAASSNREPGAGCGCKQAHDGEGDGARLLLRASWDRYRTAAITSRATSTSTAFSASAPIRGRANGPGRSGTCRGSSGSASAASRVATDNRRGRSDERRSAGTGSGSCIAVPLDRAVVGQRAVSEESKSGFDDRHTVVDRRRS